MKGSRCGCGEGAAALAKLADDGVRSCGRLGREGARWRRVGRGGGGGFFFAGFGVFVEVGGLRLSSGSSGWEVGLGDEVSCAGFETCSSRSSSPKFSLQGPNSSSSTSFVCVSLRMLALSLASVAVSLFFESSFISPSLLPCSLTDLRGGKTGLRFTVPPAKALPPHRLVLGPGKG